MSGDSFILAGGSFIACTLGINLKTRFGGLKAMFSGEGAFFIECSGEGDLFFNTFGALIEKDINGSFTVNTGHVGAWGPNLTYSIRGMGGLKSSRFCRKGSVASVPRCDLGERDSDEGVEFGPPRAYVVVGCVFSNVPR